MAQQPPKGKYRFNTFADITVTTQFNNIGIPLKSVLYHFNSGDVIDVQKMFFNDKGEGWEAALSAITEQNRTVPFSILTKVSDATPISSPSRTEKTFSGSTDGIVYGQNPSGKKTFWTPQVKVALGLVAGVALLIVAIKFWK